MKRLRSSDDLDSYGEKAPSKDWARREEESSSQRSITHRSSYYKSESGRKGVSSSSSSRYDRLEDDRDSSRSTRKRSDHDADSYDRRKSYDRYRESNNERGILSSSPRGGYGPERIHRSESFSGLRREFPKGFRSERDRSRREGSVSSWRRFGGGKESDEGFRSSSESLKISKLESEDVGKAKSPQGMKDAKSPPWSKDSGSEQSKSIEVKRGEDLQVESAGNNSEMEEGELEPEPQPAHASEPGTKDATSDVLKGVDNQQPIEPKLMEDDTHEEHSKVSVHDDELGEGRESEDIDNAMEPVDKLPLNQITQVISSACDKIETTADNGTSDGKEHSTRHVIDKEESNDAPTVKPLRSKEELMREKGIDLEVKTDESDLPEVSKGLLEETGASVAVASNASEQTEEKSKGKGKTVALSSPNSSPLTVDEFRITNDLRGPITSTDSQMEGPSTRGFEFFVSGPAKKTEKEVPCNNDKIKDEKLALDLSLSLPNVLLPIGSHNTIHAPGSPSQARSVQSFHSSFRTNSDGFTASMSFSGSQQFTHNPSCSLTHNEMDFEQSVKSRPLFLGVDWQALSVEEPKSKEVPVVQCMLPNGNGLHQQSKASLGNSTGQPLAQCNRTVEGSFRTGAGLEQQLSLAKQFSAVLSQHPNDIRSTSQSIGSYEAGSGYLKDKKRSMRDKDGGSLCRMSDSDAKEHMWAMGSDFHESIITMVVSEPINIVAQRFGEMSGQQMAFLKESVRDIILHPSRQWQRRSFQKALEKRSDFTLEMLLKSHRSQLEILVAMKTGLQEFLHLNQEISSSQLAEIFLNLRCRNLTCQSLLPVDECDCKICSKKNGFCSACMCLVCSKFDMASNTCSWVGCDVCLHWCHADCGLREAYIRNGSSATGAEGATEMQFHCLACDHPSEMFGFVKEVFQNFAKEWTKENLARELQYVRKIFSTSEDLRGKRLHETVVQMLSNLENKVDPEEVQNHIMHFLTDTDSFKSCNITTIPRKELSPKSNERNNGIVGSSQEAEWLKSHLDTGPPQYEKRGGFFANVDGNRDDKRTLKIDSQTSGSKEHHHFDELESIVRIKHAEAKMFQVRADDARREAEALKRIALLKNERIEEEYASRISKLRLADAEEMRKQKLEELQSLERAYQDYFHMKMRMESDIKDLLLKMDATRRNLSL